MAGGRGGGKSGGEIGDGEGPGNAEKARPRRTLPGVPPRLRGKAGTLDSTPAFLGPAGRSPAEQRDTDGGDTVTLLDEELWRVEESPGTTRGVTTG